MRAACAVAVLLACAAGAGAGAGLTGLAPFARGARFAATTTVLLSAAGPDAGGGGGGELGYRLQAALAVRPHPLLASDGGSGQDVLLQFTLESPQLMLRGKQPGADFLPRPSLWDDHPSSDFLALWSAGRITDVYLDSKDPPDVLNYKKALISLFQFQLEEGERNETDVSGECEVQYEAAPLLVRKFKHRCMWEGSRDTEDEEEEEAEAPARTERRRVVRYSLGEGGELRAAAADELLLLRGGAGEGEGAGALKARALTALALLPAAPPPRPAPAALPAALAPFPALAPHALPLRQQDQAPDTGEEETLDEAVAAHRAALEEASAGSADAAAAIARLLPALRRADAPALTALLHRADSDDIMEGLARALGLAGAAGAHAAARDAFQLAAAAPPRPALAREYLAALALAPRVQAGVARDALRLAAAGGALAPHALLAAAAAASRVQPRAHAEPLRREVKDHVLKSLAKCKDEACRTTGLLALGELRRDDVGELLLAAAERGPRAPALAALAALAAGPRAQLLRARRRLARLALGLAAPAAMEVRAAALELAVLAAPHPGQLAALATALRARGPRELRRVCWQALAAGHHPALAQLLPALDPRPADWCKRAHDGTSVVLERRLGALRLRTVQLAERGVLRRGLVALQMEGRPLLTVEIWARGLESLSAAAPGPPAAAREAEDAPEAAPEPDDAVAAGLALGVAGTRRPDLVLFESQGELLGHVWAGAGSEPTPVLRALVPLEAAAARALQAGVLLRTRADTARALALDAQAVVSLWGRTARAGLQLRAAGSARLALRLRTAWGAAAAQAHAQHAPALLLDASLDFYAEPQLCVHATQPDYTYSRNVTLESVGGAREWRVRRSRVTSRVVPGATLALGRDNDAACAALAHRHQD